MSFENDPRRTPRPDLSQGTHPLGAVDDSATLESFLQHLQTVQTRLKTVTTELHDLRERDDILQQGLARLNQQMDRARQLQLDLLPRTLPTSDSLRISKLYLPADELSGDAYDIVRLNDQQLSLHISDATGHDIAAAMLSIFTKRSLRCGDSLALDFSTDAPHELLERLNRELFEADLSECHFVTSIQALWDESDHSLLWARGGMPYPILIRKGQPPQRLVSEGGIIGAFEDQRFDLVSTHLKPGDLMLLFTDGLDALLLNTGPDSDKQRIIDTTWCKSLNPETLQAHLQDLEHRARSTPHTDWPADDITILALEATVREA